MKKYCEINTANANVCDDWRWKQVQTATDFDYFISNSGHDVILAHYDEMYTMNGKS